MPSHAEIWSAIDALAARAGKSASGLAKMSGLDPTIFNLSKRTSAETPARLHWPSTESIAKVLSATGVSFSEFAALVGDTGRTRTRGVPLIGFAQAGGSGFFDDAGFPTGHGWDEIDIQGVGEGVVALEIEGDSLLPTYRAGDRILVQPNTEPRRGDRVVVKIREGDVTANEVERISSRQLILAPLNLAHPSRAVDRTDVAWVARILWVSQ